MWNLMVQEEANCADLSRHFLTGKQKVGPKHTENAALGRHEEVWMSVSNAAVTEMLLLSLGELNSLGHGSVWQA